MATSILWSFCLPVGYGHRPRGWAFDSRRQPHHPNTVVVSIWMTFYKMSSSSKAQAGGLCTARSELSPLPSTATVATLGSSFWREWGLSFGLRLPSIYSRHLYWFLTVFPRVLFHSALRALVVRFPFIANLLIDTLVSFCQYLVSKLPPRCHRPFFLYLSFPSLFLLVVCLFPSRVLVFYTLCGYRWLRILELSFLASCCTAGTAPSKTLSFFTIFFRSGDGPDCF